MKNKIIITGSSKGLGNFLVGGLKNEYEIIGLSRTNREENDILEFNIDLTNFGLFNNLVEFLETEDIKLDGIILNAGIGAFAPFSDIDDLKYIELINLNLISQILLLKNLEKFFNDNSKIIFIGSISSKKFFKFGSVYQASKFGLRGFAGSLKNEWKNKKIFFLNPKILDTDFHKSSKVELSFDKRDYTEKQKILDVIRDILSGKEKRFEIDF